MEFFNVNIEIINPKTFDSYNETIHFKSEWAARYMARKYAKCEDVREVTVVDATTGEMLLWLDYKGDTVLDCEG